MRSLVTLAIVALLLAIVSPVLALDAPRWIGAFPIQDKIGLKWQPTDGAEVYAIYRTVEGQAEAKLAEISQTQYFDQSVEAGETYHYTIKAVAAGVEGPASEAKTVTMPGVKTGDLTGPEWVGIRQDRGRAVLRWVPMKGFDVVAYNIQRSETPGGPYEVINSTQENKYLDMGLELGQTYYYVVSALDANFQESPLSKEMAYTHGGAVSDAENVVKEEDLITIPLTLQFEIKRGGDDKLNAPSDVVVASNGDIYITDVQNHRIVVCDSEGSYRFDFGSKMADGKKTDPPDGTFDVVFTLAIDGEDNIYATDIGNGDVQKFDKNGKFVRRYPTRNIEGEKRFCPTGIALLPDGAMLLADRDNDRFMKVDTDAKVQWAVGSKGEGDGQFVSPNEICVNSKGTIYVVDVLNQRIQAFDSNGKFKSWFGGVGNIIGTFARPKGLFIDAEDRLWIADGLSNAIQVYGPDHKVQSTIGGFTEKKLWMNNPRGIVVRDGRLYVVDRNNGRLLVFKMS